MSAETPPTEEAIAAVEEQLRKALALTADLQRAALAADLPLTADLMKERERVLNTIALHWETGMREHCAGLLETLRARNEELLAALQQQRAQALSRLGQLRQERAIAAYRQ